MMTTSSAIGPYDSTCLSNSPCREGEFEKGFLDYVGAVYGDEAQVRFDGQLTEVERDSVERAFGRLSQTDNPLDYLSRARRQFFARRELTENSSCHAARFELRKYSVEELGSAVAMGGYRGCGDSYGRTFRPLELEIASNPGEWVFFIEGSRLGPPIYGNNGEKVLFIGVAKALGIPVRDPILPPNDPGIIRGMQTTYQKSRLDLAVALALDTFMPFIYRVENGKMNEEGGKQVLEHILEEVAKYMAVSKASLEKEVRRIITLPRGGQSMRQFMAMSMEVTGRIDQYTRLTNSLSPASVKASLARLGRRRALFIVRSRYFPMVENLYGSPTRRD